MGGRDVVPPVMALSSEDEMRAAFRVFDLDGNGLIDSEELRLTMSQLGETVTEADVNAMIRAVDQNNDGKVDYEGGSAITAECILAATLIPAGPDTKGTE